MGDCVRLRQNATRRVTQAAQRGPSASEATEPQGGAGVDAASIARRASPRGGHPGRVRSARRGTARKAAAGGPAGQRLGGCRQRRAQRRTLTPADKCTRAGRAGEVLTRAVAPASARPATRPTVEVSALDAARRHLSRPSGRARRLRVEAAGRVLRRVHRLEPHDDPRARQAIEPRRARTCPRSGNAPERARRWYSTEAGYFSQGSLRPAGAPTPGSRRRDSGPAHPRREIRPAQTRSVRAGSRFPATSLHDWT